MSDPQFLAGERLPAGKLQDVAEYGTWTPDLTASTTDPTLGAGTVAGEYHRNGRLCTVFFEIVFGAGMTAGSGNYRIEGLPFTADPIAGALGLPGVIRLADNSLSTAHVVFPRLESSTQVLMMTTAAPTAVVTQASPIPWATSDSLRGGFAYTIA